MANPICGLFTAFSSSRVLPQAKCLWYKAITKSLLSSDIFTCKSSFAIMSADIAFLYEYGVKSLTVLSFQFLTIIPKPSSSNAMFKSDNKLNFVFVFWTINPSLFVE